MALNTMYIWKLFGMLFTPEIFPCFIMLCLHWKNPNCKGSDILGFNVIQNDCYSVSPPTLLGLLWSFVNALKGTTWETVMGYAH